MKTHYERSIDVDVPASLAFTCWERFQDFPAFAEALEEVTAVAPGRTRWRAHFFAGIEREWTAEITERIPGRRIAWCSRSGSPHAGCVTFHRLDAGRTRVMLQIDYLPDGLLAAAGDILRVPQRCIEQALLGFKAWVEGVEPGPDLRPERAGSEAVQAIGSSAAAATLAGALPGPGG